MIAPELDNPVWESLASRHQSLALPHGDTARYPALVAPFLAVAASGAEAAEALASLVPVDDSVYLLGPVPSVPAGWSLKGPTMLAQMICTQRVDVLDGPGIILLTQAHRSDVLALTSLVYPHYFRPQTMQMGRYFGIYQDGQLAAMIGERLGTDATREISTVCTLSLIHI